MEAFSSNTFHHHPRLPSHHPTLRKSSHDVVVVGGGIIGLTAARHLLLHTDLSVALLDARVPCSGATGAGQGYVWMGHRTPGAEMWEIALRSKRLWEDLAEELRGRGVDPLKKLGWKETGSLLLGRTSTELAVLERRVRMFCDAGLNAELLSSAALSSKEPEIDIGKHGGAAFFPNDCQLDAMKTVSYIENGNRYFSSRGRYAEFYNNPAVCIRYNMHGDVEAIQTPEHILYGRKAIVIAAGAWSGLLMQELWGSNNVPNVPVKPRKGHLLVVENGGKIQLNHGVMESGYIDHLSSDLPLSTLEVTGTLHEQEVSSISMTATIDTAGNLILGSSRQFCGFDTEINESIVKEIWERACEFLPSLRKLPLGSFRERIRVGLRPWMPDGKPVIDRVPGSPNVVVAAGHEGCGLCTALGTAELVADLVTGNPTKIRHDVFSFHGRHALTLNVDSRLHVR